MAKISRFQGQETAQSQEQEDDDDEEEAISLCDFILHSEEKDSPHTREDTDSRTSSDPSDFFEFLNDLTSEMCHAEDIIFCGKLVPYKKQPVFDTGNDSSRRYCESLPEQLLTPTKSRINSSTKFTRSCRSLDFENSCRDSTLAVKPEGSCVPRFRLRRSVKFEVSKPRWYGLMFGVVKYSPPEMDLRDMKNRQVRRNSGSVSRPAVEGRERIPANQRNCWGDEFLNVLSCKTHTSVASSSRSLVPRVNLME